MDGRGTRRVVVPGLARLTIGLLLFLGLSALGGGTEMLVFPHGNEYVPGEWLDHIPLISSWIVPGLVLGIVFGLGSLVTAAGLLWRWLRIEPVETMTGRHWSWAATLLIGFGLVLWIGLEVILLPERDLIELIYGLVAVGLIALPLSPAVRDHLREEPSRR